MTAIRQAAFLCEISKLAIPLTILLKLNMIALFPADEGVTGYGHENEGVTRRRQERRKRV